MSKAGSIIFDNLPIIFAVGVAPVWRRKREGAALAAMISFFVMKTTMNAMLDPWRSSLQTEHLEPEF